MFFQLIFLNWCINWHNIILVLGVEHNIMIYVYIMKWSSQFPSPHMVTWLQFIFLLSSLFFYFFNYFFFSWWELLRGRIFWVWYFKDRIILGHTGKNPSLEVIGFMEQWLSFGVLNLYLKGFVFVIMWASYSPRMLITLGKEKETETVLILKIYGPNWNLITWRHKKAKTDDSEPQM